MAKEFIYKRTVEFSDTDLAGIMHFAQFFRYMESAEHALLRSMGYSVHQEFDGRMVGWPRVNCSSDFLSPLRFEDQVEIAVIVSELKDKSVTYQFEIRLVADGRVASRGSITAVCAIWDPESGKMRANSIPPQLADALRQYL